ncbi:hypothetical protein B0H14DRAFT_1463542 [Mycena olivaceomarginata]|nr:hypothetical protein B0H14DRAFT_1463542 [Mycena olivaceomarginata]
MSSPTSESESGLSPHATLGETQIALVIATWLFGVLTLQTFNYYSAFPKDGKFLKGLVGSIWFLELGQTIACWHSMYMVTVTYYGQPEHILSPPLSMEFSILFHALIAISVQTFFLYRVWVLSSQWFIPIFCCVLNLVRLAFNIVLFADLAKYRAYSRLTKELKWEVIVAGTTSPVVDIIIMVSLVYYLWDMRNTQFKQTTHIVNTIVVWTLERTLLTTATGVMQVVLYLARHDLSWLVFFLIQGKLFSNSMLASLNGRTRFRSLHDRPNGSHALAFNTMVDTTHLDSILPIGRISETQAAGSRDIYPSDKREV